MSAQLTNAWGKPAADTANRAKPALTRTASGAKSRGCKAGKNTFTGADYAGFARASAKFVAMHQKSAQIA